MELTNIADDLSISTDFPYQYRPGGEARDFLEACPLSAKEREDFASGNWCRLRDAIRRSAEPDFSEHRVPVM